MEQGVGARPADQLIQIDSREQVVASTVAENTSRVRTAARRLAREVLVVEELQQDSELLEPAACASEVAQQLGSLEQMAADGRPRDVFGRCLRGGKQNARDRCRRDRRTQVQG
jgi:hypothetical protein